jgi:hypothetical protein
VPRTVRKQRSTPFPGLAFLGCAERARVVSASVEMVPGGSKAIGDGGKKRPKVAPKNPKLFYRLTYFHIPIGFGSAHFVFSLLCPRRRHEVAGPTPGSGRFWRPLLSEFATRRTGPWLSIPRSEYRTGMRQVRQMRHYFLTSSIEVTWNGEKDKWGRGNRQNVAKCHTQSGWPAAYRSPNQDPTDGGVRMPTYWQVPVFRLRASRLTLTASLLRQSILLK